MKKIFFGLLISSFVLCLSCNLKQDFDPVQFVNQKIGTAGHGHTFMGANVPYGFVQLGPTSIPQQWDWCSGYHDSDSTVIGFSHTHLNGTGIGDLFDVSVMPVIGNVNYTRGTEDNPESGLWSYAIRSQEISEPGYYSVPLSRYGIKAELTASTRVGFHRYHFPATEEKIAIVFDLENGGCWDKTTECKINLIKEANDIVAISGYRYSTGWAKNQKIYFYAEFNKKIASVEIHENTVFELESKPLKEAYARVNFENNGQAQTILVKVGLSAVSEANAKENMQKECPNWDFDLVRKTARDAWSKELSKIKITSKDEKQKQIFYTALYHTMIAPSIYNDVNGEYRGSDDQVHKGDFTNYTTFSLWDTYRAAQPLMTLIHPEKMSDIINTMLNIYLQQGKLPVWHLMSNETDCMVGNPGAIVVADAIVKKIGGFNKILAWEAIKSSLMLDERGQDLRRKYGYIPANLYKEAIANDMEYAIADGAAANAAKVLGLQEDEEYFRNRSFSYRKYMDDSTKMARGRFDDGSWRYPFNPFESNHRDNDYCEGNAWQYSWLAPQDFDGLVKFYGGKKGLVAHLDKLFAASSVIEGHDVSPDISGLIGQYVHGNEPSHHIIYFYTMAGERNKAADKIREVLSTMYNNTADGLAGNEDVGQMSAWYILSSLGFYQVEPASTRFYFGVPAFEKVEIQVGENKSFSIQKKGKGQYIKTIELNGTQYDKDYIDYQDIIQGGKLKFIMN